MFGADELLLIAFGLALVALPVLAVRDQVRYGQATWAEAGKNRWLWLAVVILIPVFGAALYYRFARPSLRAVRMD